MKKLLATIALTLGLLMASASASAWWGNGWGGWNPWPVWTPMYWAEEMFGDNDWYGGPYGYYPYGGYGYGYPYGGYGQPYYGGYGYPYYGAGYGGWGNPYYGW